MPETKAGLAYFALVFAAGFLLGTLRVIFIIPMTGELTATLLELPVMLALSWIVCGVLTDAFRVPARTLPRLVMGATAFVLLMAAEYAISALMLGRTLAVHLEQYRDVPAQLGLAGQICFAAFPLVRASTRHED